MCRRIDGKGDESRVNLSDEARSKDENYRKSRIFFGEVFGGKQNGSLAQFFGRSSKFEKEPSAREYDVSVFCGMRTREMLLVQAL